MSVIPVTPWSEQEYAGTYSVTATPLSNYLIVSLETKDNDDTEYSPMTISSGTPLSGAGILNNGKYDSTVVSDSFSVDSSNPSQTVKINSVPVRYAVTYHQNHGSPEPKVYKYFNKNASESRPEAQVDVAVSGTTYVFSDVTPTFAATGFTAPSNQHFVKWNTASDGSGTDYAESVSVTGLSADTDIYAIYANDSTYTINVFFDSSEVDTPTIS